MLAMDVKSRFWIVKVAWKTMQQGSLFRIGKVELTIPRYHDGHVLLVGGFFAQVVGRNLELPPTTPQYL